MHSLKDKFDELCLRIGEGRRMESTGSEPIYYLVFPVRQILDVKRHTPAWIAKLENKGWHAVTFSMAEGINNIFRGNPLRKFWIEEERALLDRAEAGREDLDFAAINKTLTAALNGGTPLVEMILSKLDEAASTPGGLLLLTDLEALHPYLRINAIEAKLQDRANCPVIVLYPGKREGKTSLRFLEFYPADPNYRSEHIG
jgi:hypothetical protein